MWKAHVRRISCRRRTRGTSLVAICFEVSCLHLMDRVDRGSEQNYDMDRKDLMTDRLANKRSYKGRPCVCACLDVSLSTWVFICLHICFYSCVFICLPVFVSVCVSVHVFV